MGRDWERRLMRQLPGLAESNCMSIDRASYTSCLVAQLGGKIGAWRNKKCENPNDSKGKFFWNLRCAQRERATNWPVKGLGARYVSGQQDWGKMRREWA